jgi:hypothetical protein
MLFSIVVGSVADPDPAGSGPFWSYPNPDPTKIDKFLPICAEKFY